MKSVRSTRRRKVRLRHGICRLARPIARRRRPGSHPAALAAALAAALPRAVAR